MKSDLIPDYGSEVRSVATERGETAMKIGLLQEGEIPEDEVSNPRAYQRRYEELIEEAVAADALGFSVWGTSEQHFSPPRFTVSAPEVLYAAIAARTKQITLRPMSAVLCAWNHPILVAERLATLDIVSGGRAELCTARSNNAYTLEAFGVDPSTTRQQWSESIEVLIKALTEDEFEHDGELWKVPRRRVVPKPVNQPHPALSVAASSVQTHANAARQGIGVIGFENYFGWDYLQECVDAYRNAEHNAEPVAVVPNDYVGLYVSTAHCAPTSAQAAAEARDVTLGYFKFILDLYRPMAKNPSYEYMAVVDRLVQHEQDLDFLLTETPSVMVGSPEDFVARLRRLEEIGVDEVVMRVDGLGHEKNMQALELIGREVIPAFAPAAATA
jgi:alkanesulfonate monooxygenase SsuD/methylene tetrahydromethanopterin reductase-like flavin-dependent oxidoreductase (luciferase family)